MTLRLYDQINYNMIQVNYMTGSYGHNITNKVNFIYKYKYILKNI